MLHPKKMADSMDNVGPIALLLASDPAAPDARSLQAMLSFFDIPWRSVSTGDVRDGRVAGYAHPVVLASAQALVELLHAGVGLASLCASAASVYVYGWKTDDSCQALLREISGDPQAAVRDIAPRALSVSMADEEAICGPLSGVTFNLEPGSAGTVLHLRPRDRRFASLASTPQGELFAALDFAGVRFYLDASPAILNIHQLCVSHFDVRESFSGAVATVLFLRNAFRDIWWQAPELNACLILDDLLLKERHGYFRYADLLRMIDRHRIAATVAFIPWNWRLRDQKAVELVRYNADRISVCIHGCDHGRNEFAIRSVAWLDARARTGKQRMNRLLMETEIHHDDVQVFPQGKFCPEAGAVLKQNGLLAAVNTEPAPLDHELNCTTIADQWGIANLRYGGFPIFSRRNIHGGVENFAFDALLGKPCFIAGHHDLFHSDGAELIGFLEKLHSLKWKLNWRTVESAICRSYKVKERSDATWVKMYAERLVLENSSNVSKNFSVVKDEGDLAHFKGLALDGQPCEYHHAGGQIQFTVKVAPHSQVSARCEYLRTDSSPASDPIAYRVKIALLRHVCIMRDSWVARSVLVNRSTLLAMKWAKQLSARRRHATL